MDNGPDLVVDSVTGVDVALPVAGPGVRAFAFLIDWNIRTILTIAWYVVAAFVYNRGANISAPISPSAAWFVYVIAPPAAIYSLYHVVLEILTRGRTPGKRMAGIEIVNRNGGAPSVGALLARNVFRLVDSFPVAYAVGLVTTMMTRNNVRVGDLAAGTLLIYSRMDAHLPEYPRERESADRLDTVSAEIVSELLQRWPTLDVNARQKLARAVLPESDLSGSEDDMTLRMKLERLIRADTVAAGGIN
jgi:uncharacterized RDD family membrane protein YckC